MPRLLLAGDVMTGRGIDQVLPTPVAPTLFEGWVRDARDYVRLAERAHGAIPAPVEPSYVWGDALAAADAAGADLRIVNLETAITTSSRPWPGKGIHYRMHPAHVGCLRAFRIDGCSLANNHVLDWGRAGLRETLRVLAAAGLHAGGAGADADAATAAIALPLAAGGRVLVSAWAARDSGVPPGWDAGARRAGVALLDDLSARGLEQVARGVRAARRAGDLAVVSLHWGANWVPAVPQAHVAFAHALVDAGAADLVHGHSSHHPLAIEVYRGRAILYGCGDLLNDYEGIAPVGPGWRGDLACLYLATLDARGMLQALDILALRLRRFRLERGDDADAAWLRSQFDAGGHRFGTWVEPRPDGGFALRWREARAQ